MAENETRQGSLFTEAEILRDDFLSQNDGKIDDALLAACQMILKLSSDLEQARYVTSVGYLRRPTAK